MAEILLSAGPEAKEPYRQTPLDFAFDGRLSWALNVQPFLHFRLTPRERPLPRLLNDSIPGFSTASDRFLVLFVIIFYGVILVFGWNFVFPSSIEQSLWRTAALVVVCSTAALVAWQLLLSLLRAAYFLHSNNKKITPRSIYHVRTANYKKADPVDGWPVHNAVFYSNTVIIATYTQGLLVALLVVAYVLSRLYITAEALACLRAIPAGCFRNVDWTKYLPHF